MTKRQQALEYVRVEVAKHGDITTLAFRKVMESRINYYSKDCQAAIRSGIEYYNKHKVKLI